MSNQNKNGNIRKLKKVFERENLPSTTNGTVRLITETQKNLSKLTKRISGPNIPEDQKKKLETKINALKTKISSLLKHLERIKTKKEAKQANDPVKMTKVNITLDWFSLPNGVKVKRPDKVVLADERFAIYADPKVNPKFRPSSAWLEENAKKGNICLLLRPTSAKNGPAIAIPVTPQRIVTARNQRFEVAFGVGGEKTAVSMLRRSGIKIDGRLKKESKIIEKYLDDFLSLDSPDEVVRDLERIISQL